MKLIKALTPLEKAEAAFTQACLRYNRNPSEVNGLLLDDAVRNLNTLQKEVA